MVYAKNSQYTSCHLALYEAIKERWPSLPVLSEYHIDCSHFYHVEKSKRYYVWERLDAFLQRENIPRATLLWFAVDYIVDIYLPYKKTVIEVDGSSHQSLARQNKDEKRDEYMKELGYRVLRFRDEELNSQKKIDAALDKIARII